MFSFSVFSYFKSLLCYAVAFHIIDKNSVFKCSVTMIFISFAMTQILLPLVLKLRSYLVTCLVTYLTDFHLLIWLLYGRWIMCEVYLELVDVIFLACICRIIQLTVNFHVT